MGQIEVESETSPLIAKEPNKNDGANNKRSSGYSWKAVTACILLVELCERLTFYSITSNQVIFANNILGYTSPQAVNLNLIFTGVCYFIPILGGLIADSYAGRFNSIFGSGLIYLVGTLLIPAVAFDYAVYFGVDSDGKAYGLSLVAQRVYFILGLALIAIGTGGIKPNVCTFGAQQVEPYGKENVTVFFNWFYWMVNLGSFIAFTGVAYIQQNVSFFLGYSVPPISMALAVIIFATAQKWYIKTYPTGSVYTRVFNIFVAGIKGKYRSSCKLKSFLDYASESNGGAYPDREVRGVQAIWKLMPIIVTIIMYWTVSNQIYNTFLVQGERMNLALGSFVLPAATLGIFDSCMILLLVPLMDRLIYPLMDKFGIKPSILQRIGFGFFIASLSMVAAGVLEIYRKQDLDKNGGILQNVGDKAFNASSISVLWQIPQFALVGTGEVFASVTSQELAYTEAPANMQGVAMGLMLAATGLGSFLGSAILSIVNAASEPDPWFPDEINFGHIEYFLFLLAGLMFVDFVGFLLIANKYTYSRAGIGEINEYDHEATPFSGDTDSSNDHVISIKTQTSYTNDIQL